MFQRPAGEKSHAQIEAFGDTWHWGDEAEQAFDEVVHSGNTDAAELLRALRSFLKENDMMAYLAMMAIRLIELHRVLKDTGSIYLHCDPTASHYLKLLMDAAFGVRNFKTEIVWKRSSAHSDAKQGRKQHGRIHDVLFFTQNQKTSIHGTSSILRTISNMSMIFIATLATGRRYRLGDITGPGGAAKGNPSYEVMGVTRYWRYSKATMEDLIAQGRIIQTNPGAVPAYKRYLDEMPGVPLQDVWSDINPIGAQAQERLGYPTQKPIALLERIVKASSNEGDTVLDPFCGCGTAVHASVELEREWLAPT